MILTDTQDRRILGNKESGWSEWSGQDHSEHENSRSLDTNLFRYIVAVKSLMNLTCWIHDSNLIHC